MPSITAYSGIVTLRRKDLEALKAARQKMNIHMAGLLVVAKDISPALANETIGKLAIRGIIRAPSAVKQVLLGKKAR